MQNAAGGRGALVSAWVLSLLPSLPGTLFSALAARIRTLQLLLVAGASQTLPRSGGLRAGRRTVPTPGKKAERVEGDETFPLLLAHGFPAPSSS